MRIKTCLLDSNVLLRRLEPGHPHHEMAEDALEVLLKSKVKIYLAPQNLYEFWVVATRPEQANGLGLSVAQAHREISRFLRVFELFPESPLVFDEWRRLTAQHEIMGKQAHDCRLVAFMLVHQISHLLTFNFAHFRRFESGTEITVVEPGSLLETT